MDAGRGAGPGTDRMQLAGMTSRCGEGAVVVQQHPLGHEVTRVLAGVPANPVPGGGREPPSGSRGGQPAALSGAHREGRSWRSRSGWLPARPHPAAGDHHHPADAARAGTGGVGSGACATSRG